MDFYNFCCYKVQCLTSYRKLEECTNPHPRSGHRMVLLKDNLYVFGGFNPDLDKSDYADETWQNTHPLFQELWSFNIFWEIWTRLSSKLEMPSQLASHSMNLHGSYMLVYGGTGTPFGTTNSNSVHICHLPTNIWKKLDTSGSPPEEMYGQAICRKDNMLYAIGGTTGFSFTMDVNVLNLNTLVWEEIIPKINCELRGRYRHEVVEYNGSIFVFGGGTSDTAFPLNELPSLDLSSKTWYRTVTSPDASTATFPEPRRCHILVQYKHYVIIHGGMGEAMYSDFWKFNLKTKSWLKLPCVTPYNLHFHAASISEHGCLYLFGGVCHSPSRSREMFKVWIDVPPLFHMAWEAVKHYCPNLKSIQTNKLRAAGIPHFIVNSLERKASLLS